MRKTQAEDMRILRRYQEQKASCESAASRLASHRLNVQPGEKFVRQKRTRGDQPLEQGIAVIAAQRRTVERRGESTGAFDQRHARGYVPFIFRNQSKGNVSKSGRNQRQLISDRAHGANLEVRVVKFLPFAALDLAAARQHQCGEWKKFDDANFKV